MHLFRRFSVAFLFGLVFLPLEANAHGLTGTLVGTVKDAGGGVIPGALIRVKSAALIGGERRSEERRVGKECGYQCRSRWSPYH